MTHIDDDSGDNSFLYDEEAYNPKSELATNAGTGITGSAAATARLEATLVPRPVNRVVNLVQGTAMPPAVHAATTATRQSAPTTTSRGAAWTDFECLCLVKAWISVNEDPSRGTYQKAEDFYNNVVSCEMRVASALFQKWTRANWSQQGAHDC
jgi:hypothetical protein